MIGRQVGRFRIVARLGEGGMGSVWRAEDPLLARPVALKFLSEGTETPEARRRFLREARATSALEHPGVATVYEAGEHEGRLFIAMALVDGETVSDLVASGPLPLAEAARIAAEAGDALEHAHLHGVVHRDISARNIMRARDGHAVVIDFGIAVLRDATQHSSSGSALGTLAYVAPEVLRGQKASRLSDLYGLGVVLYEMTTGRLPFHADQPATLVYAILNGRPAPPRELRPDLTSAFERLILRAMARDPKKRHPSAAELAEALRALRPGTTPRDRAERGRAATPTPTPRRRRTPRDELPANKVLAVLPFAHLATGESPPGAVEFARGLAETLSASLARVPRLQIFPPVDRTAIVGPELDPAGSARRLGANLALAGHVRRAGEQIRVSYSLIDARDGAQRAGDQVDGSAQDLLGLEDALLASVVRALRVQAATGRRVGPLDPEAHERYLRALGHLQRRDDDQEVGRAIELLEGLVATQGDTPLVHAALARAYLRKAKLTFEREWRTKAEASCRVALSLDPHSADVLVILARVRLETGKMDEALEALRQALAIQGEHHEARLCLAQALRSRGQFQEAERVALEAIALRPDDWLGYDQLAVVYFQAGRFGEAATEWERVVARIPDHALAHRSLGATYYHLGRFADSMAAYRRSLDLHPDASAYVGLGTVLFFSGRRAEALEMFARATELRPADPRVWGNLADAQRWTAGREADSERSFERAITLTRARLETNPQDAEGWSQLAKWLAKRGRRAESLEAIERALGLAPENVPCFARAVAVYHLAGDRDAAIRYMRAAARGGYSRWELMNDPELEDLRRDSRVQQALRDDSTGQPGTSAA